LIFFFLIAKRRKKKEHEEKRKNLRKLTTHVHHEVKSYRNKLDRKLWKLKKHYHNKVSSEMQYKKKKKEILRLLRDMDRKKFKKRESLNKLVGYIKKK